MIIYFYLLILLFLRLKVKYDDLYDNVNNFYVKLKTEKIINLMQNTCKNTTDNDETDNSFNNEV